jgi:hypothetical protein
MKDITWELKNLDSLKEYIFDELIGEHKNTNDINEAINKYAESYNEMKLKLLGLYNVSDTLIAWEQFKKANWYESKAVDVEKMLMDKFQAIYGR